MFKSFFAVVFVATASSSAHAAAITGTASCGYSAVNNSRPFYGDQGNCIAVTDMNFTPGSTNDFAAAPAVLPGVQVGASYSLRALFGDLGAYADAYAYGSFISNRIDTYTIAPQLDSIARVNAAFQDEIALASNILSVGAPVSVRYSGRFEGDIIEFGNVGNGATGLSSIFASFSLGGDTIETIGEQFCIGFAQTFCTRVTSGSFSYTFNAKIGDRFSLQSSLETFVDARAILSESNPFIRVSSTADALNSAHTFLDPVSSDFYLLAESGHDYTSPFISSVSEPSTGLLLAGGLMALLCRHRVRSASVRLNGSLIA